MSTFIPNLYIIDGLSMRNLNICKCYRIMQQQWGFTLLCVWLCGVLGFGCLGGSLVGSRLFCWGFCFGLGCFLVFSFKITDPAVDILQY